MVINFASPIGSKFFFIIIIILSITSLSHNSTVIHKMAFNAEEHQHMRYNPLKGEWILVSPHRTLRPWSGQHESLQEKKIPSHDPHNPLCPGVQRPSGLVTPNYTGTYVFPNDYPALLESVPSPPRNVDPLFQMSAATGVCRVMCFHENSDVILPTLPLEQVVRIVDRWIEETEELGKLYTWVQIFENKGAVMGCSNAHPHCQIWASNFLPNEGRIKNLQQKEFFDNFKKPLLIDYMEKEIVKQERLVCENEDWIVVVPFWAVWPYETMVLPKRHIKRFTDVNKEEKNTLANIIQQITTKYDNLFKCNFPYSMGWHGAPTGVFNSLNVDHWTFHGVYYPPLLRSATIKKFMVGYEMLAQSQRDMTAEKAAALLRNQPNKHYTLS